MKDATPIYPYSAAYAREHGELDAYRASHKENVACKQAIEAAIREHYRDNNLGREAAQQVIEKFGLERVQYVLANTVRQMDWDGRISNDNKAWANNISVYDKCTRSKYSTSPNIKSTAFQHKLFNHKYLLLRFSNSRFFIFDEEKIVPSRKRG